MRDRALWYTPDKTSTRHLLPSCASLRPAGAWGASLWRCASNEAK